MPNFIHLHAIQNGMGNVGKQITVLCYMDYKALQSQTCCNSIRTY